MSTQMELNCVATPEALRDLLLGPAGAVAAAPAGTLFVDFSMGDPATIKALAVVAETYGSSLLEAPVSGGVKGAAGGTLTVMVGGSVAIAILWRQIFGKEGVVNQVLALFGVIGPSWISTPQFALDTLIVLHIWQFGASMLIFLAGLKQIPQDLYDAAAVDGAGPMSKFFRITVPMLTPVIFFNLIMGIIGAFKAFTSAYVVSGGSGGPLDSTLFYTLYLYKKGFTDFEMGYASAMAWVLLLIIAACTALVFRSSRLWVHYED